MSLNSSGYEATTWPKVALDSFDFTNLLAYTVSEYCHYCLGYKTTKNQTRAVSTVFFKEGLQHAGKIENGDYRAFTWPKALLDRVLVVENGKLILRGNFDIVIDPDEEDVMETIAHIRQSLQKNRIQTAIDALEKEMNMC